MSKVKVSKKQLEEYNHLLARHIEIETEYGGGCVYLTSRNGGLTLCVVYWDGEEGENTQEPNGFLKHVITSYEWKEMQVDFIKEVKNIISYSLDVVKA